MNPPNRLDHLRTLRNANADMAFATAFATLVQGAFLVGFIKLLGGSDIWIGVMSAIPSLLGILQIPGSIWGRSYPSFKRFVTPGGALWRLAYVPLVLLPLAAIQDDSRLIVLAACVTIASAAVMIVQPTFNDWLAEMVPPESRGFFYSRRNAIGAAIGAVVGVLGGLILDDFRSGGRDELGFALIFGVGIICAAASQFFYLRMTDLPRTPSRQTVREGLSQLKAPFSDASFRPVLLFVGVFVFGQMFAGNLWSAFALESLKMPFTLLQLCGLLHAAGNVLSSRMWGYLADKFGNKPVLLIGCLGVTLTPLPWMALEPGRYWQNAAILLPMHVLFGIVWAGVNLCFFNLLLVTAKSDARATYLGAGMATQSLIGGISPLLGAALMAYLRPVMDPATAYKWVFFSCSILRLVAVFMLLPVRETGATRIREAIRDLGRFTPRGLRAMRTLARSSDEEERQEAIRSVGDVHYSLAVDEVTKALHDPSPKVRREAALTLARLNDPRAAEALVHQLDEHPDLVEEETVEALGHLGGDAAIAPLLRFLQSPRSQVRRAAAKALGRIGSHSAVEALVISARPGGDVELRRASLQALRAIRAAEAADVFREALGDPHPSVRIAAAEAVSELCLGELAPDVRRALRAFPDEASSELAYALGAVGELADVPTILEEAAVCLSVITRRRCLLGVARLLDVEREAYRLLLLEGMPRDRAVDELLRARGRKQPRMAAAHNLYSSGDEAGALAALAKIARTEVFDAMAAKPVSELFLVAICALRAR